MKALLYPIIGIILMACGPSGTENSDEQSIYDTIPPQNIDTSIIKEELNENLVSLLNEPLDLINFKKEYGSSHSGSGNFSNVFDQPDSLGFLYSYFFFYKLKQVTKNQYSTDDLFDGFRIYVYKFGEEVGRFSDTNEVLMGIECRLELSVLDDLNVVGMEKQGLTDWLGEPQIKESEQLYIYQIDNKVLSAHIENNTIDWFKYAVINDTIDLYWEVPDYFKSY